MQKSHAIILEDISFAYKERNILENVNLEIQKGEFASIVGPNGGGKTTLLKLILGLIKPDRGKINIFDSSPREARERIGYMPQYAHLDMNFPASVMDVVLMGRVGRKKLWFSKEDKSSAVHAVDQVGMREFIKTGFSELSSAQILTYCCLMSQQPMLIMKQKRTCSPFLKN